jgi:hypothetical protein
MAKKLKAGVDFQLFDNGSAVATLTPLDAVGIETTLPAGTPTPAWTSSDPGVVVSASTDGLSAIVTPATPPVLVQGATITATATLLDGTVITGTSEAIDVVPGGPVGFQVVMSSGQAPVPVVTT